MQENGGPRGLRGRLASPDAGVTIFYDTFLLLFEGTSLRRQNRHSFEEYQCRLVKIGRRTSARSMRSQ